jgi:hypothetical protein
MHQNTQIDELAAGQKAIESVTGIGGTRIERLEDRVLSMTDSQMMQTL